MSESHLGSKATFSLPRHLVGFDLRRLPSYRCDVLVVGSGVGGASAALAAAESRDVVVLAKDKLELTATAWAQGGIAAVWSDEDSLDAHIADTLTVGGGLCDPAAVRAVVSGGRGAIEQLLSWGARFDASGGGLELSREGGHSHARVIHALGDRTGREVQRVLKERLLAHPRITCFESVQAVDVLTDESGAAQGVIAWSQQHGWIAFLAESTILATGGGGQIYRETTNPPSATGDGLAMALRAGAVVRDPELVQFHPTLLYIAGAARALISEIVRGAGARLVDRDGVRFLERDLPDGELSPRDVVSRAIFRRMVATRDTSVYLDLSGLPGDVREQFPGIARVCGYFDIDIRKDPIPVRPGAHYMVGGVKVDLLGRTSVARLYACGEVASTGLHGANRLGSNSLLEGLVLGSAAGRHAAEQVLGRPIAARERASGPRIWPGDERVEFHLDDMLYSLKSLMWRNVGIEREPELMQEACQRLAFWARYFFRTPVEPARAVEVANVLTAAALVAHGAMEREESRGVHARSDFAQLAPEPYHVEMQARVDAAAGAMSGEDASILGLAIQRVPPAVPLAAPLRRTL
ncbi:MAG: L-aspartate oxidase [Planctomycetes bacterium]|nr:L-aspartate oxidase [Planctomycetota bacterium]